jgi:hypothetical protein
MPLSGVVSTTRALTAAVACLFVLVIASPASASSFAVGSAEFNNAVQTGQQVWGGMPCGGNVRFGWRSEDPAVNATSYWGPGYTNCEIVFNRDAGMSYAKFCTVMAHELGHLHGHGHTDDPDDLMSAIYYGAIAECGGGSAPAPASGGADEEEAPVDPAALRGVRMTKAQLRARACNRKRTRRAVRKCKRAARRSGKRTIRRSVNGFSGLLAPVSLSR